MCPPPSKDSVIRTQAESAVRSQYKTSWENGKDLPAFDPAGGRSLQAYLPTLPEVKEAAGSRKPVLLFFHARPAAPAADAKKATARAGIRQAVSASNASLSLMSTLFGGGNLQIGMLTPLFKCVSKDLGEVAPTDNPVLNRTTAPLVAVLHPSGRVIRVLQGNGINERSVYDAMMAGLVSVDASAPMTVQRIAEIIRKKQALEVDLLRAASEPPPKKTSTTVKRMGATAAAPAVGKKEQLEAQKKQLQSQEEALYQAFLTKGQAG